MSMPYPKDTSEDGVSQSINLKINVQVLGAEGDHGYHQQPPLPSPPPPPPAYTVTTPTPIATTYMTVVKPKEVVHHKKVFPTNSLLFYWLFVKKIGKSISNCWGRPCLFLFCLLQYKPSSWSQLTPLKGFLS